MLIGKAVRQYPPGQRDTKMIDVFDWRYAKAINMYCHQDEVYAELSRLRKRGQDLSVAEYVAKYRLADFEKWLVEKNIHIEEDV